MTRMVSLTAVAALLYLAVVSAQTGVPQTPTLQESIAGRDNFDLYCASCHGASGRGDGPSAAALRSRPADLTVLARSNDGRFPRERVVAFVNGTGRTLPAHGPTEMPVWGTIFRAFDPSDVRVRQRIENLVTYIESIQVPSTGPNEAGSQLFRTYCASCHGSTARGDGPMADQLRHVPPDLTTFTARNGGVFPSERVYRIIDGRDVRSHGDRQMPVWGDAFRRTRGDSSEESVKARIDAIVKYLEGIQQRAAELTPSAPNHFTSITEQGAKIPNL